MALSAGYPCCCRNYLQRSSYWENAQGPGSDMEKITRVCQMHWHYGWNLPWQPIKGLPNQVHGSLCHGFVWALLPASQTQEQTIIKRALLLAALRRLQTNSTKDLFFYLARDNGRWFTKRALLPVSQTQWQTIVKRSSSSCCTELFFLLNINYHR